MDAVLGLEQVDQVVAVLKVDGVMADAVEGHGFGQCVGVGKQHLKPPRLEVPQNLLPLLQRHCAIDAPGGDTPRLQRLGHPPDGVQEDAPDDNRLARPGQLLRQFDAAQELAGGLAVLDHLPHLDAVVGEVDLLHRGAVVQQVAKILQVQPGEEHPRVALHLEDTQKQSQPVFAVLHLQ